MNVLINYLGRKGGAQLYSYEMTKAMINQGINVYGIISNQIDNLEEWRKLDFKKLVLVNTYTNYYEFVLSFCRFIFFDVRNIKKNFKNIDINFIYIPMITPWMGVINYLFKKASVIITLHDPIPHSGENVGQKILFYLGKIELKKSKEIIILSNVFKKYVMDMYNRKECNVHVIQHGIFEFYKQISTDNVIYSEEKVNFLFFGRIEKYKGLHVLYKAFKKIEEIYPEKVTITVAGNGNFLEYEDEFNKLKNAVVYNRWIKDDEVNSFFTGANIITILPYLDATQSGVISIAMINQSIVIASDVGGISEQIKNGSTGILVKPGDSMDLYHAMKDVVDNKKKYDKIAKNAYLFAKKNSSWDALGKRIIDIMKG